MTAGDRYATLPTKDLLEKLLGVRETRLRYRGSLRAIFTAADTEGGPPAEKLIVALEIVKRLMAEELRAGVALTSPGVVREYLKLLLRDLQHEVFVCLWLDAQHRVMVTQEAFRGSLTQTS